MHVLLAGKTVVVSGAAGGVGRSVVSKLLAEGARVCAADIAESVLDLEELSEAVVSISADVTPGIRSMRSSTGRKPRSVRSTSWSAMPASSSRNPIMRRAMKNGTR